VDIGVFILSLFLALIVRYRVLPGTDQWWSLFLAFLPSWIFWIVAFYTADLYNIDSAFDELRFVGRLFGAVVVGALVSALIFYLNNSTTNPKTILVLYSGFLFVLLWAWRFGYGRVSRLYLPRRSTAFVGVDDTVVEIVAAIETNDHLGYEAAAFLDEAGTSPARFRKRVSRSREAFLKAVKERGVSLVVVTDEGSLSEATRRALLDLIDRPVRFTRLPEFYEHYLRKIPLGTINDLWFLENIDLRSKGRYGIIKRGLDIAASLVLFTVALVPWALIALGITVSSRGPVLFRQERLGRGGKSAR
jgi:FlaA1/EpsC-like NDP-sugar epimerase